MNANSSSAAASATAAANAAPHAVRKTKRDKRPKTENDEDDDDSETKTKRLKQEKKPKTPAPIKEFAIATGHIFKWPSQHKELKAFLAENGYFVAIPDDGKPLVPNADDLVLDALTHMGIDLRSVPLTDAPAYWIANRPSSIANGIVAGEVRVPPPKRKSFPGPHLKETHIGHCEFAWKVRTHPMPIGIAQYLVGDNSDEHRATLPVVNMAASNWCTVKEIIKLIVDYAESEHFLHVGFDSINLGGTSREPWWHVDIGTYDYQHMITGNPTDLQMMYNARECNQRTGGLMVKPTSHLHHTDVVRRNEIPGRTGKNPDFIRMKVDPETGQFTESCVNTLPTTLVVAPPHAITGWLSQTIHCNACGSDPPLKPNTPIQSLSQLFPRLISYVSYYPSWVLAFMGCTRDAARQTYFWQGTTTNHSSVTMIPKRASFREKIFHHQIQPYTLPLMSPLDYTLIASSERWGIYEELDSFFDESNLEFLLLNVSVAINWDKKTKKMSNTDAKGKTFYKDVPLTAEELLWIQYSQSTAADHIRERMKTKIEFVDDEGVEPLSASAASSSSRSSSSDPAAF